MEQRRLRQQVAQHRRPPGTEELVGDVGVDGCPAAHGELAVGAQGLRRVAGVHPGRLGGRRDGGLVTDGGLDLLGVHAGSISSCGGIKRVPDA